MISFESCLLFASVLAGCTFWLVGWWLEVTFAAVLAIMCLAVMVLQSRAKE